MLMITECKKCNRPGGIKCCPFKLAMRKELEKTNLKREILRYHCHEWKKFEKFFDLKPGDVITFHLKCKCEDGADDYWWEESEEFTGKVFSEIKKNQYYEVDALDIMEDIIKFDDRFKEYYERCNIGDNDFIIPVSYKNISSVKKRSDK